MVIPNNILAKLRIIEMIRNDLAKHKIYWNDDKKDLIKKMEKLHDCLFEGILMNL
jgi:hypothetical protein